MARYGFDRNEVQVTKTTLIDKDGFIFETDKPYSEDPSDYDVIFIDYDGTVPYTYMADDFLAMKKFPPDPQHEGLISRGWNWDFDEAQAYVRKYGALVIGETYSPADGATRITVSITTRPHVPIYFQQSVSNGVEIDWGDKTSNEFLEGIGDVNTSHDYAEPGEYVIRLKAKDGCTLGFGSENGDYLFFQGYYGAESQQHSNLIKNIVFSDSVETLNMHAFGACMCLEYLIFPDSITSIVNILGNNNVITALNIYNLKHMIFPKNLQIITGIKELPHVEYVSFSNSIEQVDEQNKQGLSYMRLLKMLTLPERLTVLNGAYNTYASVTLSTFDTLPSAKIIVIPDSIIEIPNECFNNLWQLKRLYISNGIEEIGNKCFSNMVLLENIKLPSNLRTIGEESFVNAHSLTEIIFPDTLESVGSSSFTSMISLKKLILPDNLMEIGSSAFKATAILEEIKLPSNIQTTNTIINVCVKLEKIVIPASVTSFSGFSNMLSLHDVVLLPTTPPTTDNRALKYNPVDVRFWVPYSSDHSILNAYKAATGWSARADYIFELNEDGTIPDNI